MRKHFVLACLLATSACATVPVGNTTSTEPVSTNILDAITRADMAYQRARPAIDLLVLALPADRQTQVRTYLAAVDYWIGQARLAVTAAEALAALRQASSALGAATVAAVPPH